MELHEAVSGETDFSTEDFSLKTVGMDLFFSCFCKEKQSRKTPAVDIKKSADIEWALGERPADSTDLFSGNGDGAQL